MLVHLSALARAARRPEPVTGEERELLLELEALLALRLVDPGSGALTSAAIELAPAAGATLAAADAFFQRAESLGADQSPVPEPADAASRTGHLAPVGNGPVWAVRR